MARVHHLEKGQGYGFHLASEKGAQYIRKIDPDSPAERSGIKDGDRLLGVNDMNVIGVTHKQIVGFVRDAGEKVDLVVASPLDGITLASDDAVMQLMPRECKLTRQESGFGFVLHSERVQKNTGFYMTKITTGGAAWSAGVHEDDKIISIDGVFITNRLHVDVVELIKNKATIVMTLVHRATTVGDEMAKIIKTPAIPRNPDNPDRLADGTNGNCESPALSESQSKTSTIAEINSYPIVETQSENIVESPSDTVMNENEGERVNGVTSPPSDTLSSHHSATNSFDATDSINNNENDDGSFDQIDFANMTLRDLKTSIRNKKSRGRRSADDINWSQNKNLFKEL